MSLQERFKEICTDLILNKGSEMSNSNIVKNYEKVLKMESVAGDNLVEVLKCDEYGKFTFKDYLLVESILKSYNADLSELDDILFDIQTEVAKRFK
jgi:hypothetical protein